MPEFVFVACAPADVGDKLLDLLMEVIDTPFETSPVFTHGTSHGRMKAEELVTGRASALHAQVLVTESQLKELVARLRTTMPGTGLRYWATRLEVQGEIV